MISFDSEYVCLLELLKGYIYNKTPALPENVNWERVFEVAKVQCVVPLLASYVPKEYRNEWLEISLQSKAHYMQMLYEQKSLIRLLKSNSIPFVIIKGTASAIYYPVPSSRVFGDIDFYVPKDYWDTAKILLENNGYNYLNAEIRHFEYEKNGLEFELHSKIGSIHYNDVEHIFINGFNHAVEYKIGDCCFPGLPKYENGLVLLGHIMQHLKSSGIGIRQIIDWIMFVRKELDDSSWEKHFRHMAVEAGLEKLAITVTFMCKKWLGLSDEISWCNDADEEVADQLLYRILFDGNFGNERYKGEIVKNSFRREGTYKYLQRVGIKNLPLAQKYVFVRPIAWLYQFFRFSINGLIGLIKGEKLFRDDKDIMNLKELWKELK